MQPAERLYYLTQDLPGRSHSEQVRIALDAGARWIQIRAKRMHDNELCRVAEEAVGLAHGTPSRILVNDRVEVALRSGAHGVHLGLEDLPVVEARLILGDRAVIGATAHTLQEAITQAEAGADYLGVGPFRWTDTKTNLRPVLGPEGLRDLMNEIRKAGIELPVFAIGGIRPDDIKPILDAGADGAAVSSAINRANDPQATWNAFKDVFQIGEPTEKISG